MDVPEPDEVRTAAPNFEWAERGYGAPTSPDPDPLQAPIDEAAAYVWTVTGRPIDSTMPAQLAPLAFRAIVLRAEQLIVGGTDDYVETVNDDGVQSFSIGPYSETRRSPSKNTTVVSGINPWTTLSDLLWLLMTDEKKDEWRALLTGAYAPAFQLGEVDWTNGRSGRGYAESFGLPGPTVDIPDPHV